MRTTEDPGGRRARRKGGKTREKRPGAKPNPDGTAGQGGIVLSTETVNAARGFDLHPLGTVLAPGKCTALSITAVPGDVMTVRTTNGHTLTFNLQIHQFQ
jgi:hypothetical protein